MIIDSIYRDVTLSGVTFGADPTDFQKQLNFRILQNLFIIHNVPFKLDPDLLVTGNYRANLDFLLLMKNYWDQHASNVSYNPFERRNSVKKELGSTVMNHRPSVKVPRNQERNVYLEKLIRIQHYVDENMKDKV